MRVQYQGPRLNIFQIVIKNEFRLQIYHHIVHLYALLYHIIDHVIVDKMFLFFIRNELNAE